MDWTAEAEARLKEIPFFVRPAARKKIEKFAQDMLLVGQEHGISTIIEFATQLMTDVDCFDLVSMKQLLLDFPRLLARLSECNELRPINLA